MKLLSLVFMMLIISGSKEKQATKPVSQNEQHRIPASARKLSIEQVGELRFRKSYNMTDKEHRPTYYDYDGLNAGSPLLKRFKALGYLNNKYELLTKKLTSFKLFNIEKPDTTFHLADNLNNEISCQIKKADSVYTYDLFVADSAQRILQKIDNKFILPGLQFSTLDIVPGGFKEVILLDAYYIIKGDNYDFFIYEIKYN